VNTNFNYVNEIGELLYRCVRSERTDGGKTFCYQRLTPEGIWVNGLDAVRKVPYHLPQILAAVATGVPTWLVEGEKDAETLDALGLVASSSKNFKAWKLAEFFKGAKVNLLYDADTPGRRIRDEAVAELALAGVGVRTVDLVPRDVNREDGYDVTDWLADGHDKADLLAFTAPVDGVILLDDIAAFIADYVVLSPSAADILSLFVVHEHALEAFETTPYLLISSAEKRSGKTRLLDVLNLLLARPFKTARTTVAQLVREIGENRSTLLLDEAETVFGAKGDSDPAVAQLRGIIDAGFQIEGESSLTVPDGRTWHVVKVPVFSCKVFASIDHRTIPDTIRDRGIPIRLKRKTRKTVVKRFYRRIVRPLASSLHQRVASWASENLADLRTAYPAVIDELSDRAFDVIEPLLAIADHVGGSWPKRLRDAIGELMLGEAVEDHSLGVGLLCDIRRVFDTMRSACDLDGEQETDIGSNQRIWSTDMVVRLVDLDEPSHDWATLLRGRSISANWLAKTLRNYRDYGVKSEQLKINGVNRRGYSCSSLEEAWAALCPDRPDSLATNATAPTASVFEAVLISATPRDVAFQQFVEDPDKGKRVAAVAVAVDGERGPIDTKAEELQEFPFDRVPIETRCDSRATFAGPESY
jgi:hypothetical protein